MMSPMGHNKQLLFSGLFPEMPLSLSRLGMSLCPLDGVVEDRRFLTEVRMVPVGPMGHNKQLLFSGLLPEMPLSLSRMGMSLCPVDGVVEDMRFLMVFHATVHVLRMCLAFYRTQIAFL